MAISKREGVGIGTSAAGGAAAGSVFGPWGTAIGAGVGALGGLLGGLMDNPEEELERRRKAQREQLLLQTLRNRAAELGAPTVLTDTRMQLKDIDNQYEEGKAGLQEVNPQDIVGLAQNVATIGANADKWGGPKFDTDDVEVPVSSEDAYGQGPKTSSDFRRGRGGILESRARRRFT